MTNDVTQAADVEGLCARLGKLIAHQSDHRVDSELAEALATLRSQAARLQEAERVLAFYANPAIYEPHPHGPGFDRRDQSYLAKSFLTNQQGGEQS